MGRAPCCEKMGLKKGPWTLQEDQVLINYINLYGHGNWRALPKQAGLLRCGKSCRLRWTNYLRPDIKRGNFSREEEEAIINLHQMLGNRWSAIAAKLPGRTDNEIKNVWHTHLKKRLDHEIPKIKRKTIVKIKEENKHVIKSNDKFQNHVRSISSNDVECSPGEQQQDCLSGGDMSSSTTTTMGDHELDQHQHNSNKNNIKFELLMEEEENNLPQVDENFWSDVILCDEYFKRSLAVNLDSDTLNNHQEEQDQNDLNLYDDMDFWYNIFTGAEDFVTHFPQL
ncbi:hypothetical protein ACFE04_031435 [Oxalis oulophora]